MKQAIHRSLGLPLQGSLSVGGSLIANVARLYREGGREPLDNATRSCREIKQESVPARADQLSNPSSLRLSTRSNLGQILNWLVQEHSNTINFGKGPSRLAAANLVYSFKELPSLASRSNAIADVFLVVVEPGLASIYKMNWIT